ncbi:coiled-coil domain-containing protein 82 [Osmerus eperlanus]|uniref:coiled-coil domain-containing protein 82 n=1 Tax=Osmerus eperlanus TaxID=29151 RepID=UPI002E0D41AD
MESLYKRRVYESMRKKKAAASKRKPQIGLSARLLDDSDEESCASTTSISSESEYQNEDSSGTERTPDSDEDQSSSGGDASKSTGKRTVSQSSRKRSTLPESSSDSDSDVGSKPARKVIPRKRIKIQSPASDSDVDDTAQKEKLAAEAKETAAKRKKRQNKLLALSKKMKSRIINRRRRRKDSGDEEDSSKDAEDGSEKEDDDKDEKDDDNDDDNDGNDNDHTADRLRGSSEDDEAKDSDSLKDFIVEDEVKKGDKDEENPEPDKQAVSLPRQFVTGSQLTHFQVVVKALLINVLDETFLKSLYSGERTKRYAQEMKSSLFHFDERTILPRLENLKQRSRWSDRYKERVECYPKVRLVTITILENKCEACQLQRQCSFNVKLSGQLYDNNTLQEDHFMPNDTQTYSVGSVCASRTEVYHTLKHFKYHLFQHCRTVLEEEKSGEKEEAVKDTVNRVFIKLQDGGWISEQFEKFQDHINDADLFQEEKLD